MYVYFSRVYEVLMEGGITRCGLDLDFDSDSGSELRIPYRTVQGNEVKDES